MKAPGCLNIRGPSVPLVRRKGVGVLWTYHADRALQERSHEFLKSWSWFLCSSLYLPHTPLLLLFTPPVLCLILQIIGLTNSLLGKERRAQTGCFADTFLALEQTFSPATRGDVKEKLAQKKPVGGTRGPNGPSPKRCVGGGTTRSARRSFVWPVGVTKTPLTVWRNYTWSLSLHCFGVYLNLDMRIITV